MVAVAAKACKPMDNQSAFFRLPEPISHPTNPADMLSNERMNIPMGNIGVR